MKLIAYNFNTKIKFKNVFYLILLFTALIVSVNYCDLHDYRAYFEAYNASYAYWDIEPGFTKLGIIFNELGAPFYIYYGILISFVIISVWLFFLKYGYSKNVLLFLLFLIYPYVNEVQQLRGATAAAIILYGITYLLNEKPKILSFVGTVMVAMLFHTTSVVYLIFIVAVKLKYLKLKRLTEMVFLFAIPFIAFSKFLFYNLFSLIPYVSMKYSRYIFNDVLISKAGILDWFIFGAMLLLILQVINDCFYRFSHETQILIKITFIIFILSLLRGIGNNGYRIALLMYPIYYVALSNIAHEIKNRTKKILILSVLCFFPIISLLIWWGPLFPDMYERITTEMWKVWNYYY